MSITSHHFVRNSDVLTFHECVFDEDTSLVVCSVAELPWTYFNPMWKMHYTVHCSDGAIYNGHVDHLERSPNYPQFCFELLPDVHYTVVVTFALPDDTTYIETAMLAPTVGETAAETSEDSSSEEDEYMPPLIPCASVEEADSIEEDSEEADNSNEADNSDELRIIICNSSESGRVVASDCYLSRHGDCLPHPQHSRAQLDQSIEQYAEERERKLLQRRRCKDEFVFGHPATVTDYRVFGYLNPNAKEFVPASPAYADTAFTTDYIPLRASGTGDECPTEQLDYWNRRWARLSE